MIIEKNINDDDDDDDHDYDEDDDDDQAQLVTDRNFFLGEKVILLTKKYFGLLGITHKQLLRTIIYQY